MCIRDRRRVHGDASQTTPSFHRALPAVAVQPGAGDCYKRIKEKQDKRGSYRKRIKGGREKIEKEKGGKGKEKRGWKKGKRLEKEEREGKEERESRERRQQRLSLIHI
eukprot:TRINITY_DN21413_c0_g1_i1.p3 TRINITY_DN21413_c0_g1~~TRINITY_DN21413_c0_g1_i1.p3  ORF type:complete len:108 (+),score=30.35 TRINITY_DN21413_c0_g1_i1:179-502(+)